MHSGEFELFLFVQGFVRDSRAMALPEDQPGMSDKQAYTGAQDRTTNKDDVLGRFRVVHQENCQAS